MNLSACLGPGIKLGMTPPIVTPAPEPAGTRAAPSPAECAADAHRRIVELTRALARAAAREAWASSPAGDRVPS